MKPRISLLLTISFIAFLFLFTQHKAKAQYVVISSSLTYNPTTNQVIGISQTEMDYYTQIYYQAYVEGYLYKQGESNPVSSGSNANSPGYNSVASVTTQVSGSPNNYYSVQGRHTIGIIYQTYCGSSGFVFWSDPYFYNYYGAYAYGPTATIYGRSQMYCAGLYQRYINFGTTNNSITVPPLTVNITNPRISGNLNGSTRNALLGANVILQANPNPAGMTGGTYTWNITAPYQLASGTINSQSPTIYWTQPGTYTAQVTYNRNGVQAQATINVNVVAPTLPSFYANRETDLLGTGTLCGDAAYVWSLGCRSFPGGEGINFFATAEIPAGQYLSDPAQSGIKFVQIVSTVRKIRFEGSSVYCLAGRSSEDNVTNSWRIDNSPGDSGDPYENTSTAVRNFAQGNSLTITTRDSPAMGFPVVDAVKVDDRFQTFVVYYAGGNPSTPNFQLRLGSLSWNWGGQYVYDSSAGSVPFRKQFTYGQPGQLSRDAVASTQAYQGANSDLDFNPCPWGPPAPAQNQIDGSRFFVRWHYLEVLHRQPDAAWNTWVSFITQCGFDNTCINTWRIAVSRGFFESAEFWQDKPAMTYPGTPEYNAEYVRQLYLVYLQRQPDAAYYVWLDYLNNSGDYAGVVGGFINSIEYRRQFGPP